MWVKDITDNYQVELFASGPIGHNKHSYGTIKYIKKSGKKIWFSRKTKEGTIASYVTYPFGEYGITWYLHIMGETNEIRDKKYEKELVREAEMWEEK